MSWFFKAMCFLGLHSNWEIKVFQWSEQHEKMVLTHHSKECVNCNKLKEYV